MLEIDELVDGLRITESKLLYQKEILNLAIQKALIENDMKLSAKFFVSSLIVDSIIEVFILFSEIYSTKSILYFIDNQKNVVHILKCHFLG